MPSTVNLSGISNKHFGTFEGSGVRNPWNNLSVLQDIWGLSWEDLNGWTLFTCLGADSTSRLTHLYLQSLGWDN